MYDVEAIVRIGSAGAYREPLKLFDVLLAVDSYSESSYAKYQGGFEGDLIPATPELCDRLRESAGRLGVPLIEGVVHSSDIFYRVAPDGKEHVDRLCDEKGCLAVEMESFGLFHNARVTGKQAACVLTISDTLYDRQETTAEQREKSFFQMMEVALGIL